MRLRKILSGGQTGADQTGLRCAKEIGLETGGFAPKLFRTEDGTASWLKDYGLVETDTVDYKLRTRLNVEHSDATFWFGNLGSPGYWCTRKACEGFGKPFLVNPSVAEVEAACATFETLNIAGNRASKNPVVVQLVRDAFATIFLQLERSEKTDG